MRVDFGLLLALSVGGQLANSSNGSIVQFCTSHGLHAWKSHEEAQIRARSLSRASRVTEF